MKTEIDTDLKIAALAQFLGCSVEDVSEERHLHYDMEVFSAEGGEYAVATDEEADAAWEQYLDSYIEECIQPELENLDAGSLGAYIKFDEESWKRDARLDGRGHSLSGYDEYENEETLAAPNGAENITLYIFRIN